MNKDFNQTLQNIANAKKQGKSPQMIINMMLQANPQMQQTLTQLKNMVGNRSPKEFFMQLAKQNGADDMALAMLGEMFNN